ncbi:olfactory receptor 13F1 [Megalops cyprinoides]|uniref:olfactory receptor 13F1 n=1 Tax=Megalops cyprinoides TaxID=118141 RepID=UPI001863ED13|nr:olfactory receptor 13F1 [Megalops cyprinoides]
MTSSTHSVDVPGVLQTGVANVSSGRDGDAQLMNAVKACVHSAGFLATSVFSYFIVVTVCGTAELRQNLRYVLLCHHCSCIAAFNAAGGLIHTLRTLRLPAPRILCWVLFDLQVALARSLVITLTLMALDTCLSVCWPLRYPALVHGAKRRVMLVTWVLALLSPVMFTVLACAEAPRGYLTEPDPDCPTALEGLIPRISALAFLALLTSLILLSYALIYWEGRRAGHFSRSNSRGRRTILIHGLQISLHILPGMVIISRLRKSTTAALANFMLFSLAQALSPIVYGLRSREIRAQLPRFLPRWTRVCWRGNATEHASARDATMLSEEEMGMTNGCR